MFSVNPVLQRRIAALIFPVVLAACGGGGGGGANPAPVPVGSAPALVADVFGVNANQDTTLNVLANDSHPDHAALELVSVTVPQHGVAAIKNGELVYTPAVGYFGPDKMRYTVRAAGGTATATAEASVTVSMPLRLSGQLGLPAATGSTVTVTVGTRAFTQTVAPDAVYDVPVVLDAPEQMVTVTAQASGAGNTHIKMISLAGSAASLYRASNGVGTVGQSQLADLNVNLISTGRYVTLRRFNGGRVPASQTELDTAAAIAPPHEMVQMASVLRLTVASLLSYPALALPAGVGDTLALALDTPAYTAFAAPLISSQDLLLARAIDNIVEDPRTWAVLNLSTERERIVSLLSANYNVGVFTGTELIISPDGTAQVRHEFGTYAARWSKGNDTLLITLAVPFILFDPSWQGEATISTITVRQITGGATRGLSAMTMSGQIAYVDTSTGPYKKTTLVTSDAWDSLAPLSVQEVSGKTFAGLPDMITAPNPNLIGISPDQMRVAFAADGTATLLDLGGASASWTIQNGKLRIAYADGSVQELARRVAKSGRDRWIVRHTKGAQFQLLDAYIAQVQLGLVWSAPLGAQNWRSLAYEEQGLQPQFFVNLLADFSGTESNVNLDGTVSTSSGNSWLLNGGELIVTVYRLPNGNRAGVCPAGVTCTIYTRRRWTLLRDDGDSVTVLDHYTSQYFAMTRVIGYQRHPR